MGVLLLRGTEGTFWSDVPQLLAVLPTPRLLGAVTRHFLRPRQLTLPEVLLEESTTAFKDLSPGVFLFAAFNVFIATAQGGFRFGFRFRTNEKKDPTAFGRFLPAGYFGLKGSANRFSVCVGITWNLCSLADPHPPLPAQFEGLCCTEFRCLFIGHRPVPETRPQLFSLRKKMHIPPIPALGGMQRAADPAVAAGLGGRQTSSQERGWRQMEFGTND